LACLRRVIALVLASGLISAGDVVAVPHPLLDVRAATVSQIIAGTSCPLFPADNVWNADISNLPVDTAAGSLPAGTLHADLGPAPYGIPFNVVANGHAAVFKSQVGWDYPSETDAGPYAVGSDLSVEAPTDSHVLTVNRDTCRLAEAFAASSFAGPGPYRAGSGATWDLNTNALRPDGWTSGDAAGLPILPGLVRYDEVYGAGAINHAIRFTVAQTRNAHIWPARHDAGIANTSYLRMGERLRLKSSFDISRYAPDAQVVLRAMQHYGIFVSDNGSNWYFQGTQDARWTNGFIHSFDTVPGSAFEPVDESPLMVDANSGAVSGGAGAACGPAPVAAVPAPPANPSTFYFAEGYTGAGFRECIDLLMPSQAGTASIDYFTEQGHSGPFTVAISAGQVVAEDVSARLGPGHDVAARITFSGPGVAERVMRFNRSQGAPWTGSTDQVGVTAPATEWDFAEGSTYSSFSEYLTLQNPRPQPVTTTLTYLLEDFAGQAPVKTVVIPGNSRATVAVFVGDTGSHPCPDPATCGVGPGWSGVGIKVTTAGGPLIAERSMYVNGCNCWGDGVIWDGHDSFGATAPANSWDFAEGSTSAGLQEYLTIANPDPSRAATISATFYFGPGQPALLAAFGVAPHSRITIPVETVVGRFRDVSVHLDSSLPVVAERPMYLVHDFGSGPVAGAHDGLGWSGPPASAYSFATASTLAGEADFLTFENRGLQNADVSITYFPGGRRSVTVGPGSRATVDLRGADGPGPGLAAVGIAIRSTLPILVEKPTYGTGTWSYGATVTQGVPG